MCQRLPKKKKLYYTKKYLRRLQPRARRTAVCLLTAACQEGHITQAWTLSEPASVKTPEGEHPVGIPIVA